MELSTCSLPIGRRSSRGLGDELAPAEVNDDSDTSTTSAAVSVEDSKEVPGEIVWIVACSF